MIYFIFQQVLERVIFFQNKLFSIFIHDLLYITFLLFKQDPMLTLFYCHFLKFIYFKLFTIYQVYSFIIAYEIQPFHIENQISLNNFYSIMRLTCLVGQMNALLENLNKFISFLFLFMGHTLRILNRICHEQINIVTCLMDNFLQDKTYKEKILVVLLKDIYNLICQYANYFGFLNYHLHRLQYLFLHSIFMIESSSINLLAVLLMRLFILIIKIRLLNLQNCPDIKLNWKIIIRFRNISQFQKKEKMLENNHSRIAQSQNLQAPLHNQYPEYQQSLKYQHEFMTKSNKSPNPQSKRQNERELLNHQQAQQNISAPKDAIGGSSRYCDFGQSKSKGKIRMYGSKRTIPAYTVLLNGKQNQSKFILKEENTLSKKQQLKENNFSILVTQDRKFSNNHKQNQLSDLRPQSSLQKQKKKLIGSRRVVSPTFTMIQPNNRIDDQNRHVRQPSQTYVPNFCNLTGTNRTQVAENTGFTEKKNDLSKSKHKLIGRQRKVTAQIDEIGSPYKKNKDGHQIEKNERGKKDQDQDSQNINIEKAEQTQKKFLLSDYHQEIIARQNNQQNAKLIPKNMKQEKLTINNSNCKISPKIDTIDEHDQSQKKSELKKQSSKRIICSIRNIAPKIDIIEKQSENCNKTNNKKQQQTQEKIDQSCLKQLKDKVIQTKDKVIQTKDKGEIQSINKDIQSNQKKLQSQKIILNSNKSISAKIDIVKNQQYKNDNEKQNKDINDEKMLYNSKQPKVLQKAEKNQKLQQNILCNDKNKQNNIKKKNDTYLKNKKVIACKSSLAAYVVELKGQSNTNSNQNQQPNKSNFILNEPQNYQQKKQLFQNNEKFVSSPIARIKSAKKQTVILKSEKKMSAKIDRIQPEKQINNMKQNKQASQINVQREQDNKNNSKQQQNSGFQNKSRKETITKASVKKISAKFDQIKQEKDQTGKGIKKTFIKQQQPQILQQGQQQLKQTAANTNKYKTDKKQTIIIGSNKSIKAQIDYVNKPIGKQGQQMPTLEQKQESLKSLKSQIDFILESEENRRSNKSLKSNKDKDKQLQSSINIIKKQEQERGQKKSVKIIPSNKSISGHLLEILPNQAADDYVKETTHGKEQIDVDQKFIIESKQSISPQQRNNQDRNDQQQKHMDTINQRNNNQQENSNNQVNQQDQLQEQQQQIKSSKKIYEQQQKVQVGRQNKQQKIGQEIVNEKIESNKQQQQINQCNFILQESNKKCDSPADEKCPPKKQRQQQRLQEFILSNNKQPDQQKLQCQESIIKQQKNNRVSQNICQHQQQTAGKQIPQKQNQPVLTKRHQNQNVHKQKKDKEQQIDKMKKDPQQEKCLIQGQSEQNEQKRDAYRNKQTDGDQNHIKKQETQYKVDNQNKQNLKHKQSSQSNEMGELPQNTTDSIFVLQHSNNDQTSLNLLQNSNGHNKMENYIENTKNQQKQQDQYSKIPGQTQQSFLFKNGKHIQEQQNGKQNIQQFKFQVQKQAFKQQGKNSQKLNKRVQKKNDVDQHDNNSLREEQENKKSNHKIEQKQIKYVQKSPQNKQMILEKNQNTAISASQKLKEDNKRKSKVGTQYLSQLRPTNQKESKDIQQKNKIALSSSKSIPRRGSQVDLVPIKLEQKNKDGYSQPDKIKSKPSVQSVKLRQDARQSSELSDRSALSGDQKGSLKALVRISPRQYNKQQEQGDQIKKRNNVSSSKKSLDCETIQLKTIQNNNKNTAQYEGNARRSSIKKKSYVNNNCQLQISQQQPSTIKKVGYCKFKQGQQKKQYSKGMNKDQYQIKINNEKFIDGKNQNNQKFLQQQKQNKMPLRSNNKPTSKNCQSESKHKKIKIPSPYLAPVFNNFQLNSTKSKNSTFYNGSDLEESYEQGKKINRHRTLQVNEGQQSQIKDRDLKKYASGSKNKNNAPFNQRQMQKLRAEYQKLKKIEKAEVDRSQRSTRKSKRVRAKKQNEKSNKNIQNSIQNDKQKSHNFLKAHSHQFSYLYPTVQLDQTKGKLNRRLKDLDKKLNRVSYSIGKRRQQGEVHEYIAEARRQIQESSKYLAEIDNI